jgi:hypothetical protein
VWTAFREFQHNFFFFTCQLFLILDQGRGMFNRLVKNITQLYKRSAEMKKAILVEDSDSEIEAPEWYGITEEEHSITRQQSSSSSEENQLQDDSEFAQEEQQNLSESNNGSDDDAISKSSSLSTDNQQVDSDSDNQSVDQEHIVELTTDKETGSVENDGNKSLSDNGDIELNTQDQIVELDDFVDRMIQERIAEIKKDTSNNKLSETTSTTMEGGEILVEEEAVVTHKKVARNDPYSGYLAPNGRNKRQKTKKKKIMNIEEEDSDIPYYSSSPVEYNGVIVSYTQDSMPSDMAKYVTPNLHTYNIYILILFTSYK